MNSLEWINKQIANVNDVIEVNQIRLDENQLFEFLKEHYQAYHKELVQLLQTLQQIKTKLEAWYILKHTFHIQAINRFNKIHGILIQTLDEEILENVDFEDYEIIKKALEVEDELKK